MLVILLHVLPYFSPFLLVLLQHSIEKTFALQKSTLKKPNPYLIKEESPDRENIDREKSRMTVKKIKNLRQKVRDGAAKCEMIATKGYNFKNCQTKMPKIKMLCFDTPLRIYPGLGRVSIKKKFFFTIA